MPTVSRREMWSAFSTLWVVCAYPLFGAAYDLTKTGGWLRDAAIWACAGAIWLVVFRLLAHKAGWWRMRRVWLGSPAALASYYTRQTSGWLVYALYCSDPRWRWATRNMIATTFGVARESVAAVTDFGGPSLLIYAHPEVVAHILNNIALACHNGVRDVVLIQHTAVCKALVARDITFSDEAAEYVASEDIVRQSMALVAKKVPHVRVWGAVMVRNENGRSSVPFFSHLLEQGVRFRWVDGKYPSHL